MGSVICFWTTEQNSNKSVTMIYGHQENKILN